MPKYFLSLRLASEAWLERALPTLRAAEQACAVDGDTPAHFDLRSDNICFVEGRTKLVDWSHACLVNPKLDLGSWLPSLHLEGGPLPEKILPGEGEVAAWIAGRLAARAGMRAHDAFPDVRQAQRNQLTVALPWAQRALNLPPLDGPATIGADRPTRG